MPGDRLLQTLLRSLQTHTDQQDTPRLLATTATLLTTLTNPLNITLLTAQILAAPALWTQPQGLQTCARILSLFASAGHAILIHDRDVRDGVVEPLALGQMPVGGNMSTEAWVKAVVGGADERSARWKHLLVLGGLVMGADKGEGEGLVWPGGLQRTLEGALVRAVGLAVEEEGEGGELGLGGLCTAMVVNYAFPRLEDAVRLGLDYDRLLPVLIGAAFFSNEGFQSAYFLGAIDLDVVEVPDRKFNWSSKSNTFHQLQTIASRPLLSSMGPLSRLIAHAVENVKDPWLVQTVIDDLAGFARALTLQWRQNKLSEIDASEESVYLLRETIETSLPLLWRTLKAALFATVIILRAAIGRTLGDRVLAADGVAPVLVTQTLHTLRNLYFISSRLGADSFSQYTFVYLSSIDILTQYPLQADAFIKAIAPAAPGYIPTHPLDRTLDLFFLNTAEHFTLALPAATNEALITAALPYLSPSSSLTTTTTTPPPPTHPLPLIEASHALTLAVLSSPHSTPTTSSHLPQYATTLLTSFPAPLTPRQFRLAFRTLARAAAPPHPLSATHPDLPATLMELLRLRASAASTAPLPTSVVAPPAPVPAGAEVVSPEAETLSEQAVVVLAMVDALVCLPVAELEVWLGEVGEVVRGVRPEGLRSVVRDRFWEVLVGGELDAVRSLVGVGWWVERGGRGVVGDGEGDGDGDGDGDGEKEEYLMSGAGAGARESKL